MTLIYFSDVSEPRSAIPIRPGITSNAFLGAGETCQSNNSCSDFHIFRMNAIKCKPHAAHSFLTWHKPSLCSRSCLNQVI